MQDQAKCFLDYRQSQLERSQDETVTVDLTNLFNKKFKFTFDNDWELPEAQHWFSNLTWTVRQLETLKSRLNFHKSLLNDYNLEEWSNHTRRRNPAGEVCWKVRCIINPEFLTQAWTKFYECAYTYSIVSKEAITDKKIVSLHLCEAPGAFITSLNHYLKQHHSDLEWKWVANTLNPYYEGNSLSNMINDDRFIFHTLDHWNFGVDNTGNLMNWENSQAIVEQARSLGKVLLVTADGSIDCLQKPDAQEEVTSPLHYCEIITALQALGTGGTLLIKLFTIFEHSTVCLLYLINLLFREVNIFKPATSRQGNSEIYAVCLNYKGSEELQQYIPILKSAYGTELYGNLSLFPLEQIPRSFLKQVIECATMFCSIQCEVIMNNIQYYMIRNNYMLNSQIKRIRAMVAVEYIQRYKLCPIDLEDEILKGTLHEENKINNNPRVHRGSYTERQLYADMCLKDKFEYLYSSLRDVLPNHTIFLQPSQNKGKPIKWINIFDGDLNLNVVFTYGSPLQSINSSKFIYVPILKVHQQFLAEEEFKTIIVKADTFESRQDIPRNAVGVLTLPEYGYSENYSVFEKRSFKELFASIKTLSIGQTIMIVNFELLTYFSVSVLYILSKKCFEKTAFVRHGVILENLVNSDAFEYLSKIEAECEKVAGDETKDVLNCLPVQETNIGEFFHSVVLFNNTYYKDKCMRYINLIKYSLKY